MTLKKIVFSPKRWQHTTKVKHSGHAYADFEGLAEKLSEFKFPATIDIVESRRNIWPNNSGLTNESVQISANLLGTGCAVLFGGNIYVYLYSR
jgi:hypothetical protein